MNKYILKKIAEVRRIIFFKNSYVGQGKKTTKPMVRNNDIFIRNIDYIMIP